MNLSKLKGEKMPVSPVVIEINRVNHLSSLGAVVCKTARQPYATSSCALLF